MAMDAQQDGSDLNGATDPSEAPSPGEAPSSGEAAGPGEAAEHDASPPAMARLSISLPRSLYRDIRLHALDLDTTLSALLIRLIHQELKVNSPE